MAGNHEYTEIKNGMDIQPFFVLCGQSILCVSFEMIKEEKFLSSTILSVLGNVMAQETRRYDVLDYSVIAGHIAELTNQYNNISQIMVGTPSIAEFGVIRHCDIPELEGEEIVENLRKNCFHSLPNIPENYMPDFIFEENLNSCYLEGMYSKALDLKVENECLNRGVL